jgi:hypothetical protein
MDEIRYQAIKADAQDLISEYLGGKVSDDELEGFITLAEADKEPVTLENEIVDEMNYRKEFVRGFDRLWEECEDEEEAEENSRH